MSKCKILIADDHPIVRKGLRQELEETPEIELLAEAQDGNEILEMARQLQPQVIVLDINMPKLDGFSVAKVLQKEFPAIKIIFLTVYREESFLNKALKVGAQGYILKDSTPADIVAGIKTVCSGYPFISPAMTSYLIRRGTDSKPVQKVESLTPTERTILKLIAQYKTTKEIAAAISVSPRTIETHRSNMYEKLKIRGSHALMKFAITHLDDV